MYTLLGYNVTLLILIGNINCNMVLNRRGVDNYEFQDCEGFGTAKALTERKYFCYCKDTSPIFYEIEPGFYCSSFDNIKRKEGMAI